MEIFISCHTQRNNELRSQVVVARYVCCDGRRNWRTRLQPHMKLQCLFWPSTVFLNSESETIFRQVSVSFCWVFGSCRVASMVVVSLCECCLLCLLLLMHILHKWLLSWILQCAPVSHSNHTLTFWSFSFWDQLHLNTFPEFVAEEHLRTYDFVISCLTQNLFHTRKPLVCCYTWRLMVRNKYKITAFSLEIEDPCSPTCLVSRTDDGIFSASRKICFFRQSDWLKQDFQGHLKVFITLKINFSQSEYRKNSFPKWPPKQRIFPHTGHFCWT